MARRVVIAVVDDDASVCDSLSNLMRASGFLSVTYNSGSEFLERFQIDEVGILITDYQMPEMTGIEILKKLRAEGNDLPVIVITALPQPKIVDAAHAAGALACLRKPFDQSALLAIIEKEMERLS